MMKDDIEQSEELKQDKAALRRSMRAKLKAIDAERIGQGSQRITERVVELAEYRHGRAVMVYLSMDIEYQTDALIRHALESGRTVCAPKVMWQTGRMYPMALNSLDDVVVDDHGIRAPRSDDQVPLDRLDFILVPGLAFDRRGRRLGRGGGFYDKLLSRTDVRAAKVAAAFNDQIVDALPVGEHDQPVDAIVTPTRQMRFVRRAKAYLNETPFGQGRRDEFLGVDF